MTILVTGARGKVGRAVVAALHREGRALRLSTRDPSLKGLPEGIPAVTADFDQPDSLKSALAGVEKVFLYAVPDSIDTFLDEARAAGIRHVVLLSSSSVADSSAHVFAERHERTEAAIRQSGIQWTFLRPGAFASNTLRWATSIQREGVVSLPYPGAENAAIHEDDIAEVAALAFADDRMIGTAPILTGPASISEAEQVETIADVLGKPIRWIEVTPEEARDAMARFIPAEIATRILEGLAAADGVQAQTTGEIEALLGRPARSYRDWVRERAESFAAAGRGG